MDEAGVRAIFEQAPDEISEQVAVGPDGRVNADGTRWREQRHDRVVRAFAHAVQPLQLVIGTGEQFGDKGKRHRVVAREGREQAVLAFAQDLRAGEIVEVGVKLCREHRKIAEPQRLRALDLGIPIGALDEPHRQHDAAAPRARRDPADDLAGALLIGLDDDAEPGPAVGDAGIDERAVDVEVRFEPVALFGVDHQRDVHAPGRLREFDHARDQLVPHAPPLQIFVAWVERRQLDRNAVVRERIARFRVASDTRDRRGIAVVIAPRVVVGAGRLAQHVEACKLALVPVGALDRRVDAFAHHELLAEQLHRRQRRLPDHRLARAANHRLQQGKRFGLAAHRVEHQGGRSQGQAARRQRDDQRAVLGIAFGPVAPGDLVADQSVRGGAVGDAQQGLGKAHQHDAFLGRKAIPVHQLRDERLAFALGLCLADQRQPACCHRLDGRGRTGEVVPQRGDDAGFVAAGEGADGGAIGGLCHRATIANRHPAVRLQNIENYYTLTYFSKDISRFE